MELVTNHARARMQQRGIRPEILEALLDFGRESHVERGRDIVYFDKKARARLAKANAIAARDAERLCKSYAILGPDGSIITVGHRYRRISRA